MAYVHGRYSYPADHQQMLYYQQPVHFPHYPPHAPQLDHYYPAYGQAEYADFAGHGAMHDDFEEGGEVSTRPRLTKEQVEVLEAQFQSHPKPNSIVKRQLALQTKLTLPRVANWFQNRRAKAKQQRKQEEFEITQQMGLAEGWKSEDNLTRYSRTTDSPSGPDQAHSPSLSDTPNATRPSSVPVTQAQDPAKEASWASLQRALLAAQEGRVHRSQEQEYSVKEEHAGQDEYSVNQDYTAASMPPPDLPQTSNQTSVSMTPSLSHRSTSSLADWPSNSDAKNVWTSAPMPDEIPFDFGFNQVPHQSINSVEDALGVSPHDLPSQSYTGRAETWSQPLQTPTFPCHQVPGLDLVDQSPAMYHSSYPNSRRGSTSDDLAANFGTFALAGTPPTRVPAHVPAPTVTNLESTRRFEGEIDLAARRKRPRPAALGTASLRSRSYGALTSMSPTLRTGPIPHPNAIRHVKSTGHSLNARFAGVRKTSSAQRSPLNISSFAEADAFHQLMAQQAANAQIQQDALRSGSTTPYLSPEMMGHNQLPMQEQNIATGQSHGFQPQLAIHTIGQLHPSMASPPATPFKTEYFLQGHSHQTMQPPGVGVIAQWESFPDYTPPYSAGPLTGSSWSDAPLTSPDMPCFPPVSHVPSLTFSQQPDMTMPQFQHFMMPPESKSETTVVGTPDATKTEFLIQEFPGQKEEHAHVAQQLAQQHPKNYVFSNTTPNDFDG